MNLILLAPPAAGKGTQSLLLEKEYGMTHISTGDLLRDAMKKEDDLANLIRERIENGQLVEDKIILNLIGKKVSSSHQGVILDGFPRNVTQAFEYDRLLETIGQKLNFVFYFDVPKEVLKERKFGRRTCPKCGKIYNVLNGYKPQKEDVCDHCQAVLTKRFDDNEETFEKQYRTYLMETEPLKRFYQEQGKLIEIDATKSPEVIFATIKKVIEQYD